MADEVSRRAAVRATLIAVPVALLVGVLAFWALGGFRGGSPGPDSSGGASPSGGMRSQPDTPVSVTAPALSREQGAACATLIARLPATLRDLARREVTAGTGQNAAYGEPPITLACAAPAPSVPPSGTVYRLSGVCWYAAESDRQTVWTTVDRTVPVAVTVPRNYPQPGQWVIEFSDPVNAALPATASAPAGCRG